MRTRPDWRERLQEALAPGSERQCLERIVDCFYEAWRGTAAAVWMLPDYPSNIANPEDLAQDFVAKLLASPIVNTLRSLTSLTHVRDYLRVCLENHCWTIARRAVRGPLPPTGGNPGPEPPAPPIVHIEDLEEMTVSETQRRIDAIRQEFASSDPSLPPTVHLLLLLERRWLLERVCKSYIDDKGEMQGDIVPADKVESELSRWKSEEASQLMTADGRTLQQVWEEIKVMAHPPTFQILDFDVAPCLEMRPNSLTTRKLRAWRILKEKHGVAYPKFLVVRKKRKNNRS
jgi:hypothetical protein